MEVSWPGISFNFFSVRRCQETLQAPVAMARPEIGTAGDKDTRHDGYACTLLWRKQDGMQTDLNFRTASENSSPVKTTRNNSREVFEKSYSQSCAAIK